MRAKTPHCYSDEQQRGIIINQPSMARLSGLHEPTWVSSVVLVLGEKLLITCLLNFVFHQS